AEVARVAAQVRAQGRRPRALYLVPNFANPSGVSLSTTARHELLAVAAEQDLLILEDDPYGLFPLAAEGRPSLKALDTRQQVVYIGSFAKSVFPGARVGFLVADAALLELSAREYGVLWTPMSMFYLGTGGERQLRLSASYLQPDEIEEGVRRIARLLAERYPPAT